MKNAIFADMHTTLRHPRLLAPLLAALSGCAVVSCAVVSAPDKAPVGPPQAEAHTTRLYGLPVDSFDVEQLTVRRGQMIGQLLMAAGLSNQRAIDTYDRALPVFDFRQMRAGHTCCLFYDPDTAGGRTLRHFAYDIGPESYVMCSYAGETIRVHLERRTQETRRRATATTISSSLWNDLRASGVAPQTVLDLSDIFAWSVDFFGLEEGDRFSIVCDEQWTDGERTGPGVIVAAAYQAGGRKGYAFRHECDSVVGYYDLQGNSLRRAFLKAPLHFGLRQGAPGQVVKVRHPHHKIEYRAARGTEVVSVGDGTIAALAADGSGLRIKHNSLYTSVYEHLGVLTRGLRAGAQVRQGDVVGRVGKGNRASWSVQFSMLRDGRAIDPERVDMPPAEPIDNDDILDFMEESDRLKASLDSASLKARE